jgi:ribosomal protein S18 acetylase RimI-like enzyme
MLGSPAKVAIRFLRSSDAPALAAVFRDSWQLAYSGIIPAPHLEQIIHRRSEAWWASPSRSKERHLVMEFEGKIAGYAAYGAARSRNRAMGEIYELYLGPIYQGVGLGEHLFEACRHRLDRAKCKGLVVWALADNTQATAFYWRRGGRPVASTIENFAGTKLEKIAFTWP